MGREVVVLYRRHDVHRNDLAKTTSLSDDAPLIVKRLMQMMIEHFRGRNALDPVVKDPRHRRSAGSTVSSIDGQQDRPRSQQPPYFYR
ncbi:hypothetical protein [Novipirellula artificiosorum]|uniref:hypothetical protein n=1 Tax=Novipirellula artificiosorum TaxID=2528016 RepID=UPI0011B3A0FB|nr:hypothetical protein [Novipirellula artificiosorum]